MNKRNMVLLAGAIVVAGIFALLVRAWLSGKQAGENGTERREAQKTVNILVAAANLPMGKLIEVKDVVWQKWPESALNPEQLSEKNGETPEKQVGKVVRTGISAGEPLTKNRLVSPGEQGFLAAILTPGMRAITIPVSDISGVGGFVFPGDRVDLILSRTVRGRRVSETVLQNVRIIGTGLRTADMAAPNQPKNPNIERNMTIELPPKLVEKVRILQELGSLSLALRSLASGKEETTLATGIDDLIPNDKSPTHTWDSETSPLQPPLVRKSASKVSIVRGSQVTVLDFSDEKGEVQ